MNAKIAKSLIICLFLILNINIVSAIDSDDSENDKITTLTEEETLPSYFSWTDINGVDFTTPVKRQQPYSSCESFAYVAALEVMVHKEVGYPFGCDLSEAHLFFNSGGNVDWGSYPENDSDYLVSHGVPDEACWPYPTEKKAYPVNTTCDNWEERAVKIKNWSYLPPGNITAIKEAIVNNGPVPVHLHTYRDFVYYNGGIYEHTWGDSYALHCVCIMGYKDDPSIKSGGYWIVKNSWDTHRPNGRPWGEDGWINIAYGEGSIEQMALLFEGVYGHFPILYVDDDNTIGPWNGSKDYPYQTINDAIDNAYEGWTIYVKNGTYNEKIVINKTINLDGENPESTIIDGGGEGIVVYVKRPNVRISGLTIQNSGSERLDSGIRTLSLDSNLTVKNCILKGNDVGLYLNCADYFTYLSTKNMIYNNTITDNNIGIFTTWVHNNEIIGNTISNNTLHGIEMEAGRTSTIKDNLICDNLGKGLFLHGKSDESTIVHNTIRNNSQGIVLEETYNCKIKENNLIDNTENALFIESRSNLWLRNYWSDWNRIIPRPIKGSINLGTLPWMTFDWLPATQLV